MRFCIVQARFNLALTGALELMARRTLLRLGARDVETVRVPGSFELPLASLLAARSGRFDAVIALGAIIKGETSHDEVIGRACADGLRAAAAETGIPVTLGVITAPDMERALARARTDGGRNLGTEAASAAVAMVPVVRRLKSR
jgi:6,7-dimethyl-8-ribityllumazine synthase